MAAKKIMEYAVGIGLIGLVWIGLYRYRRDVRSVMVWSGLLYVFVLSLGFAAAKLLWPNMPTENAIVPGYWNPDTFLDLGRATGGYAIEDGLYGFFTAGIAVSIYEELFRKHLPRRHARHRPHVAITVAAVAGFFAAALHINLIYSLIAFGFAGVTVIIFQRPDLAAHSLLGGFSYLFAYTALLLAFFAIFPDFIQRTYNLENLLGIMVVGIPIEEYLFAFSFGLMWSPLYEYMRDIR